MTSWRPRVRAALAARLAGPSRDLARRARRHAIPLALVAVAALVGQGIVLAQSRDVAQWPDTAQYLAIARGVLAGHSPLSPQRTPGYPLFLALVFALTGRQGVRGVVLAQAVLLASTTIEIYALAYRIAARRWMACCVAVAIALNLYIVDWERLLLTGALAQWLVVTAVLVFDLYLRTRRLAALLGMALLGAGAILTHPSFLYLPLALFALAALWEAANGRATAIWRRLVPALVASYAVALADMVGNALAFGYFGLSSIGSVNLLGKVLELHHTYGMPLTGAAPRFAALQADLEAFLRTGRYDPWSFINRYPRDYAHYGAALGSYSTAMLAGHPLYLVRGELVDIYACLAVRPWAWAPFTLAPPWVVALLHLAALENRAYLLLPVLLVALSFVLWRRPSSRRAVVLCALALIGLAQVVMAGAADYTEFYRLRAPVDWAVICLAALVALELARLGTRAAGRWLGERTSEASVGEARVGGRGGRRMGGDAPGGRAGA